MTHGTQRISWRVTLAWLAALLLLLAAAWVGLDHLPAQDFTLSPQAQELVRATLQRQQKVEKEIDAYYRAGNYTLGDPLVIQNPYGSAPLTALLLFDTPQPVQVSLSIPGKSPQADVKVTFEGFHRHHEIPVYGLYPNQLNQVALSARTESGESSQAIIPLQTEPLPASLESMRVQQADPSAYQAGMNFTFLNNKPVFDSAGDVRWYSTQSTYMTFAPLNNGHFLDTYVFQDAKGDLQADAVLMEQDLLGKVYAIYNLPDGVHHDLSELPGGNILVTSEDSATPFKKDFILELDRQSGRILRSFDLKKVLDPSRPSMELVATDWLHTNSIAYDSAVQSILLSNREQSAVIELSYPAMQLRWILASPENWSAQYQPFLLAPQGQPFEWPWSQHHATLLARQTLDGHAVVDILVFDNGNYRDFRNADQMSLEEKYSRMVVYRIDENAHTVTQVWEYGRERGAELFSPTRGSAYRLSNGDFFGNWSEVARDPAKADPASNFTKIIEVNPLDNRVVFEANISAVNYRTLRAGLYDNGAWQSAVLSVQVNDTSAFTLDKRAITLLQPLKAGRDALLAQLKAWLKSGLKALGLRR